MSNVLSFCLITCIAEKPTGSCLYQVGQVTAMLLNIGVVLNISSGELGDLTNSVLLMLPVHLKEQLFSHLECLTTGQWTSLIQQ